MPSDNELFGMINILSYITTHILIHILAVILAIVLYFLFDLLDSTPTSLHSYTTSPLLYLTSWDQFFFLIYLLSDLSPLLSLTYVCPIIISYFHLFSVIIFYQLYLFSLIILSQLYLSFSSHHYLIILSFFLRTFSFFFTHIILSYSCHFFNYYFSSLLSFLHHFLLHLPLLISF